MNLKIISAGAGSGKTYRLTQEMVSLLKQGVRPSGIIATTFTNKAAAELQERVRIKLLEEGWSKEANELTNALIGTVHSLGVKLLKRFAFEAGVSPEVDIIADEDQQILFNKSLANILTPEGIQKMEELSERLGFYKRDPIDWRKVVKNLSDIARANNFGLDVLEESKVKSFETLAEFLGPIDDHTNFNKDLLNKLTDTIERLEANEDQTKVTNLGVNHLKTVKQQLTFHGSLPWWQWAKLSKLKVGTKSKDEVKDFIEFCKNHVANPDFQSDIKAFIYGIFDLGTAALTEYDQYKKQRGLIDYIDMEIQVRKLLEDPGVRKILSSELDLLMVDEFQDTNPIQLDIFLKLSKLAKYSVWVGDPKQSIYGFRGADPALMVAIIEENGGIKPEDIQSYSWRSREDIVYLTNSLFCKAFPGLKKDQIALNPKRTKLANGDSVNKKNEPIEIGDAIKHWHFESESKKSNQAWFDDCIALGVKRMLARGPIIQPKGVIDYRPIAPGDIAILCRTNAKCIAIAESLHKQGIKAAVARTGLLDTAEARLILACLKYILNQGDSLSVAEILLLATPLEIEEIIEDRLQFVEQDQHRYSDNNWGEDQEIIKSINEFREKVLEFSSTELINFIIEDLDLRMIISRWGNVSQRKANIDVLRKYALQYEEACNRLHTAASLGGFLLWLNEKASKGEDQQGSGEDQDAVNVLTYHKSKGLEWPVVVCHNLEVRLNDNVFGIHLIDKNPKPDLDNLLGNRWLRYWINPYSDQSRGTILAEKIAESEAQKKSKERALTEEARLLYVGITRARDYLVFPTRGNKPAWLNRVWHKGENEDEVLSKFENETPWEWNDQVIMKDTEVETVPATVPHTVINQEQILHIEARAGMQDFDEFEINFKNEIQKNNGVKLISKLTYGKDLSSEDRQLNQALNKAVEISLMGNDTELGKPLRDNMLNNILKSCQLEDEIDSKVFENQSTNFYDLISREFSPNQLLKNYPVQHYFDTRLFQSELDFVLLLEDKTVLIQNATPSHSKKEIEYNCKKLAEFFTYAKATTEYIFKHPVEVYANFPANGQLIALEVN